MSFRASHTCSLAINQFAYFCACLAKEGVDEEVVVVVVVMVEYWERFQGVYLVF